MSTVEQKLQELSLSYNKMITPGTTFRLYNDRTIYEFIGYNDTTNIVYRPVNDIINRKLSNITLDSICEIIEEHAIVLNSRDKFKFKFN